MSLKLKTGHIFTDRSGVEHESVFFGVRYATFEPGSIQLICGIWKDSDAFLAYLSNNPMAPIIDNIKITIGNQEYIDYFLTPITVSSPIVPLEIMNEQFYSFITTVQPEILKNGPGTAALIDWSDWEEQGIDGVPATIIE